MKTMTCKQLGGACEEQFHANTFEEMAELSKNHALQMIQNKDEIQKLELDKVKKTLIDSIQIHT